MLLLRFFLIFGFHQSSLNLISELQRTRQAYTRVRLIGQELFLVFLTASPYFYFQFSQTLILSQNATN